MGHEGLRTSHVPTRSIRTWDNTAAISGILTNRVTLSSPRAGLTEDTVHRRRASFLPVSTVACRVDRIGCGIRVGVALPRKQCFPTDSQLAPVPRP